ncbi:MAG: SCO family protein [Verrucomicrobiales bacterium]|nr:SCO family protein [Verrucomicrobiales bacterium]
MCSCQREAPSGNRAAPRTADAPARTFEVRGIILELQPLEKTVRIRHEEIPGYMAAMTMPFEVRDTNELAGLEAGDTVSFRLNVTDTDGWIDRIRKLDAPRANLLPTRGPFRFVRDVEPLGPGDPLPRYTFTNQFGRPFSTEDFKGRALAITFIFTRCPFPTFCPRMSDNFARVQQDLLARGTPTNWHLLTISFDPDHDTPEVLRRYAQAQGAEPAHWTFATGDLVDITAIGEQFGLEFWRDPGGSGINHNLRTVVVDARGRVQTIWPENKWTAGQLVEELLRAANVRD